MATLLLFFPVGGTAVCAWLPVSFVLRFVFERWAIGVVAWEQDALALVQNVFPAEIGLVEHVAEGGEDSFGLVVLADG